MKNNNDSINGKNYNKKKMSFANSRKKYLIILCGGFNEKNHFF